MPLDRGGIALGPLIAFAVVGLLVLALRWTFGSHRAHGTAGLDDHGDPLDGGRGRGGRRPRPSEAAEDYGLLCCVAVEDAVGAARGVRDMLAAAAIRATVAPGRDGRHRVLVFESDVDRARRVLGPA